MEKTDQISELNGVGEGPVERAPEVSLERLFLETNTLRGAVTFIYLTVGGSPRSDNCRV